MAHRITRPGSGRRSLAVAVAGFFFGQGTARGEIHQQITDLIGPQAAETVTYAIGIDSGPIGAPDWIRTSDLQLRRLPLYPTELRARRPERE